MADAWGGSWGSSWGLSWTRSGVTPPVESPPIGGGYRRPIKYVRDGKVVDTLDEPSPVTVPDLDELPVNIPLSQALIDALRLQYPPDHTPALMAQAQAARVEMQAIQQRMQEDEDMAVALLLLA